MTASTAARATTSATAPATTSVPAQRPMRSYRTRMPLPDAQFHDMTDKQVLALMLQRCEQYAAAAVGRDQVILTFQAADLYELAIAVRDLQDDLQSEGFYYSILEVPRPTLVRSGTRSR